MLRDAYKIGRTVFIGMSVRNFENKYEFYIGRPLITLFITSNENEVRLDSDLIGRSFSLDFQSVLEVPICMNAYTGIENLPCISEK